MRVHALPCFFWRGTVLVKGAGAAARTYMYRKEQYLGSKGAAKGQTDFRRPSINLPIPFLESTAQPASP